MVARPFVKTAFLLLLLASLALAGCSAKSPSKSGSDNIAQEVPQVEATSTTGGIRGVVVDEAIKPIKDVVIALPQVNKTTKSDAGGLFTLSGLDPGTYLLHASSPLYASASQSVDVVAGVSNPPPIKIQLVRVISQTPYFNTLKYDGFIVCSIHTPVVLSEECGEGVGSPTDTCAEGLPPPCVPNPVFPGQRVGHNADNKIKFDFQVDNAGIATIILEQVWTATSDAGKELYTPVGLNWSCDPNCGWDSVTELDGPSPTYAAVGPAEIAKNSIAPGENITMFTWAGDFSQPVGVQLNQQFTDFVTSFYYLPPPDGWSLVKQSPAPY